MSLNRDENVVANTSLLPDTCFKKRKDSTLRADDEDDDKKHEKKRRARSSWVQLGEHVAQADSVIKGICGSSSTFDDDDDDDDYDTAYVNPYLNLVRSNVMSQEGEASHSFMSPLVPKGSSHTSVSDVNSTDESLRAQDGLCSSRKYFNLPGELCGISSDLDKYVFSLTVNESGKDCSENAGNTSKNMWLWYRERSDSCVSSSMPKASSQSSATDLNEDSAALAGHSSVSRRYFPLRKVNIDLMRKTVDHENSGISGDRTSSLHIKPDLIPSLSSESCEDLFPFNYDLHSENVFSLSSPVGTHGSGHLPAPVCYNNTLVTPFTIQLPSSSKLCENELSPSSKCVMKRKLAKNRMGDLPSSLTGRENYCHQSSELFKKQSDAFLLSLKTRRSEPVLLSEHVAQEEQQRCAVGNAEVLKKATACISEGSGIMPVKSEGVLNVADCDRVESQGVNAGVRNFSDNTVVYVNEIQILNDEWKRCGNTDHEETILVSDDSDDDVVTVYDDKDGFEANDDDDGGGDIEIVKCLSKSSVQKMDFSVQQKALDRTESHAGYRNFERKDKNKLPHTFGISNVSSFKSLLKPKQSYNSDDAGSSMDKQRGDEWPFLCTSVPEACGGSSDSGINASQCQAAKSSCLDMHRPAPAHVQQMLQCDVYDLSRSTVTRSETDPSSLSLVRNICELPRKKMFTPRGGSKFPYTRRQLNLIPPLEYAPSLDVPFPMSSESTSSQSHKQRGCDMNLVPTPNEFGASVQNPSVPNSSSGNFVACSPESILNIVPNSLQMSVEPGNQEEHSLPSKGVLQLLPVFDAALATPGATHSVQEGKGVMKQQQNTVENKTETAQINSKPEWECAVCLEMLSSKRGISATMCGHVYCTPCLTEVMYKKKECPTCRQTLDSTQVHPLFISG